MSGSDRHPDSDEPPQVTEVEPDSDPEVTPRDGSHVVLMYIGIARDALLPAFALLDDGVLTAEERPRLRVSIETALMALKRAQEAAGTG